MRENKEKSIVAFYKNYRRKVKVILAICSVLTGIIIYDYLKHQFTLSINGYLAAFFDFILFGFVYKTNTDFSKKITDLFVENIDIQSYGEFLNIAFKKEKGNRQKQLQIERGILFYFQGDFEKSIEFLQKVQSKNSKVESNRLYYLALNHYILGNEAAVLGIVEELETIANSDEKLQFLEIIHNTKLDELNYFSRKTASNKLTEIHDIYFRGILSTKQNKLAEAKAYFQEIENENPELFYVREAKRFLEMLDK